MRKSRRNFRSGLAVVGLLTASLRPAHAVGPMLDPVDKATRRQVVETLATDLADGYAYPDPGQKMAQAIRGKLARGGYDRITSAEEFARVLKADVRAIVDDQHLNVIFGAMPQKMPSGGQEAMATIMHGMNGGIPKVEILPGNIGYLQVNGEPPVQAAKEAIAASFAFLHNSDALIIDDRGNAGGDPETVALYMSYLSAGTPYVLNSFHYRNGQTEETRTTDMGALGYGPKKPVYVLTSVRTRSAGEELAYDVQAFKRGVIVGANTAGAANPGDMKPLGHGFVAFVPAAYVSNAITGGNWEGIGVKPDVAVEPGQALFKAQQLAAQHLLAGSSSETLQAAYQALTNEVGAALAAAPLTQQEPTSSTSRMERKSGSADNGGRLYSALAGPYRAPDGGSEGVIQVAEKNASLYITTPRNPEARLIPLGANRFRIDGCPEDFTAFFSPTADGSMQLTVTAGRWPPFIGKRE